MCLSSPVEGDGIIHQLDKWSEFWQRTGCVLKEASQLGFACRNLLRDAGRNQKVPGSVRVWPRVQGGPPEGQHCYSQHQVQPWEEPESCLSRFLISVRCHFAVRPEAREGRSAWAV